jgi:hypothetical protein
LANHLSLDGMNELRETLRALPAELRQGVNQIVVGAAQQAEQDVRNGYPSRTGNLRGGVQMETQQNGLYIAAKVASTAPHATIFEKGTKVRHTKNGANRGKMPAAPDSARMIPKAIRWRARMVTALTQYVQGLGLQVGPS